jgi:hypothetical protein
MDIGMNSKRLDTENPPMIAIAGDCPNYAPEPMPSARGGKTSVRRAGKSGASANGA